ncbi:MAG: hypothetical protein JWP01_1728 [Myxococcales bacterium]|nr:hypothetical protein [Myxococcales bacterium]
MLKNCLVLITALTAACAPAKDDAKGVVDESSPPDVPTEIGKADESARTVTVDVQSAHPYTNNLNKVYSVPLTGLPSCATDVRLHFSVLRTETNYDFVTVEPTGAPAQEFDGNLDNTWTEWFPRNGASVKVRLESDDSVTRHGFAVDKIEWDGVPANCPLIRFPPCGAGTVDVTPTPTTCACPAIPQCVNVAELEIRHSTQRGFNFRSHNVVGSTASETHPGPADGPETNVIGSVDIARVSELIDRAASLGLLHGQGYDHPVSANAAREELVLTAGAYSVSFTASEGAHDTKVKQLIADFEALFQCGTPTGSLTCNSGYTCEETTCIEEQSCVCPALFDPVCSTSGQTFSNGCAAACANVEVAHDGACGIPGDSCGTILGLSCQDPNKCRFGASQFTYPFPDAGGTCVAANYCDAPADCNGLVHPATPGAWACNTNACAWTAGSTWKTVVDGRFETAHPYASSTSVWKEIALPPGAQTMRLVTAAGFALEANYDFLEVWTWVNGAWVQKKRYTGATGPAATDEFPGRYHYLRFVSDSSVNKQGFRIDAQYR